MLELTRGGGSGGGGEGERDAWLVQQGPASGVNGASASYSGVTVGGSGAASDASDADACASTPRARCCRRRVCHCAPPCAHAAARLGCGGCEVMDCAVGWTVALLALVLALVVRQNVCWSSHDELDLYLSLAKDDEAGLGPVPLMHAHSHNDYQQALPLTLALSAGFCSVEADVFRSLDGAALYTGHVSASEHRLEDQYLTPLAELSLANGRGSLSRLSRRLGLCEQHVLLVDLKTSSVATWELLEQELQRVNAKAGFSVFECYRNSAGADADADADGAPDGGPGAAVGAALPEPQSPTGRSPVAVIVSGVPEGSIADFSRRMLAAPTRCSRLDGRWADGERVAADPAVRSVQAMISAEWEAAFEDPKKLRDMVHTAHAASALVRFWAAPDTVDVWTLLLDAGVDLISSDQIAGLSAFLLGNTV